MKQDSIKHYLSTELWLSQHWENRIYWYLLVGIISAGGTGFIHLFLPAELSIWQLVQHSIKEALGYCLALILADFLIHRGKSNFKEMTVGRAWLLLLITTQVGFFTLYALGEWIPILMPTKETRGGLNTFDMYLRLLPTSLVICALWIEHLRRITIWRRIYSTPNQKEMVKAPQKPEPSKKPPRVQFENLNLAFDPSDIMAVQADENYCHVYFCSKPKEIHRVTLKTTAEKLHPYLIQCHRSWLVNPSHINLINKVGRQGIIKLNGLDLEVPVSRNKLSEVCLLLS